MALVSGTTVSEHRCAQISKKAFLGLKPPWATVMPQKRCRGKLVLAKKTSDVFLNSPRWSGQIRFWQLDKTPLPPSQFLLIICKSSCPNIPYVGLSALLRNQGTCSESSKRFVSLPSPLLCLQNTVLLLLFFWFIQDGGNVYCRKFAVFAFDCLCKIKRRRISGSKSYPSGNLNLYSTCQEGNTHSSTLGINHALMFVSLTDKNQ